MKKSEECSTKPRPVSTGPPRSTLHALGSRRQADQLSAGMHIELHQQIGKSMFGASLLMTMPMAPSAECAQI